MSELLERRAKFIDEAARGAAIAANAPVIPASWDEREDAFRQQFLPVIARQMGPTRSGSPEAARLKDAVLRRHGLALRRTVRPRCQDAPRPSALTPAGRLERDKDARGTIRGAGS